MLKMAGISVEKSKSFSFYKYLCQKIGSEKVVRTRRLALTISVIGNSEDLIVSGSKGEGLDLKGSDLDLMMIDNNYKVYQSETEFQSQFYPLPLVMNTEETQPCFTQLWFLEHNMKITSNVFQKNHRGCVLSSELYKLFCKNVTDESIPALFSGKIHGPCISNEEETLDLARCLKCDKWIFQAKPWVSRPRKKWPSTKFISKIVSSGVLFVPIGCKGSINEHLEWRVSFSVAEKILVFSFSHTQILCYAMLKVLIKEVIEKHEDLKGLLCSYFLKTLMFWILEETDQYLWRPDNVIPCFMACLQRLLYCVRYSILSHYFIPDNNLFFLRFNTYNKERIIPILENLYGKGINYFASSETLPDYQIHSYDIPESVISRNSRFLQQIMVGFDTLTIKGIADRVLRLLYKFLHSSRSGLSRFLFARQISEAFMHGSEETQHHDRTGNKHHYLKYKHGLSHAVIGLHSDAVSGLLYLASFFYVHKKYLDSLTVIKYALHKYTDEKIYTGSYYYPFKHIQTHVLNFMKKEKPNRVFKLIPIYSLAVYQNSSMVPQELQLNILSSFPPLTFSLFLSFLCYYHLHHITLCRKFSHQLDYAHWNISKYSTKLDHPEFLNSLIMCGIAHQLLGDTHCAREYFQEAAKHDKKIITSAASRLSVLI